jgi:membrane-bound serine protease (ClpP class)
MPLIHCLLKYAFVLMITMASSSGSYANRIVELFIKGTICPATADYIAWGITKGQSASSILIHIDSEGGLGKSMHEIAQAISRSHVPVVTYVSPNGAHVSKEGLLILYASTLAAMAPGTYLAMPAPSAAAAKKIEPDSSTILHAELKQRYKQSVNQFSSPNVKLTEGDAHKAGVINMVATNTNDLLAQLNGKIVTQDGLKIQLDTKNVTRQQLPPGWRMRFLLIITNPTIVYLLLLAGIYAIFFELVSPGFVVPGVGGVVALMIAFYGMYLLPVNYAGFALIIIGVSLMVVQAFSLKIGVRGVGGVAAFVLGSFLLIDSHDTAFQIRSEVIWAMSVVNIFAMFIMLGGTIREQKKRVPAGMALLLGAEGRALSEIITSGQAIIRGKVWSVSARQRIAANKRLKVISAEGLELEVEEIPDVDTPA